MKLNAAFQIWTWAIRISMGL